MTARRARGAVAVLAAAVIAVTAAGAGSPVAASVQSPMAVVDARTINVMTWNVCGKNAECSLTAHPEKMVATIRWHMVNHPPGRMDAILLQEFCNGMSKTLEYELEKVYKTGWDVRFAAIRWNTAKHDNRVCKGGNAANKNYYGIAIALPDENVWTKTTYLPSKEGKEERVALCADVPSWRVKLCNAHLSSDGDDPGFVFRPRQITEYAKAVAVQEPYRVVFGGDLNIEPPGIKTLPQGGLGPLYDGWVECNQPGPDAERTGPGTWYRTTPHTNSNVKHIDYLFAGRGLAHRCRTTQGVVQSSDHRPVWMSVDLPETSMTVVARSGIDSEPLPPAPEPAPDPEPEPDPEP